MPYRIEQGQEVMLMLGEDSHLNNNRKFVKLDRTIVFTKSEVAHSPVEEQQDREIPPSVFTNWPWAFSIADKWSSGSGHDEVTFLYAKEVHEVVAMSDRRKAITVKGSSTNRYTIMLGSDDTPINCTCRGFRFKGKCKHHTAALTKWENGEELESDPV